ncbi:MAG TPA: galactofuranose ABC transporter, permease protein YjfF [Armatimonadota bacterium]
MNRKHIPLLATSLVCLLLYGAAALRYPGFATPSVFVNLLADNAVLGVAALGMTFVILSGGIDLSVGAVVGCTGILLATMVDRLHIHPALAIPILLLAGTVFGAGMGALVRWFELPPFLVTLAGMLLARGIGFVTSLESVPLEHPFLVRLAGVQLPVGGGVGLSLAALVFLGLFAVSLHLSQYTKFGRNVYALGGNSVSAMLMGLPCGRTTVLIYAFSTFCSTLAGIVNSLYTLSGNASAAAGLELDAIAAVVIGGTLLSGGVGHIAGTVMGVLILGIIQTTITFEGTLSSWWTKIAIGVLLLTFILLQRFIQSRATAKS